MKTLLPILLLGFMACGGNPPPNGPPDPPLPDCPVPAAEPTFLWRADQLEISWEDMPVGVRGGDEACVLRRRAELQLPEPLLVTQVDSFMGYDRGDTVEGTVIVYDQAGRSVYRRSMHLEGGVPECYDAFDPRPYAGPAMSKVTVDIDCRTNGPNEVNGQLAARCHYMIILSFGSEPPPQDCKIPGPNDPDWVKLDQPRSTWEQLNAAKIIVGDRTGEDPNETLALLAQAVRDKGGCAVGPWVDELAIQADSLPDGTMVVDGYHTVAYTDGGYTSNPRGDAWAYRPLASGCGEPFPPPINRIAYNLHQTQPKRTWDTAFLVRDVEFCRNWWTDSRLYCPVRPEGHPERAACETLRVGTPQWSWSGEGNCSPRPNPYMYRCDDDAVGTLTVCTEDGSVCKNIPVEEIQ